MELVVDIVDTTALPPASRRPCWLVVQANTLAVQLAPVLALLGCGSLVSAQYTTIGGEAPLHAYLLPAAVALAPLALATLLCRRARCCAAATLLPLPLQQALLAHWAANALVLLAYPRRAPQPLARALQARAGWPLAACGT